ncbi:hypothetical protein M9H77_24812 [Catharanthus roseus]|uniref:Uncharacterized protein n=1 Tax=Catharanthus roseus TaxID=4058 RepID=A0ACC0A5C2_CATRO|nr:hypothetical protein M9H77_24812 [Catharanthus roseus]
MEDSVADDRLSEFLKTGLYRLENSNTIFMDPVRVLNRYYSRFRVSPSAYYTRFFQFREANNKPFENSTAKRKRKRQRKPQTLNQREEIANQRHQEARSLLARAHAALLVDGELLEILRSLRKDGESLEKRDGSELNFVELGSVWQAPLYEIILNLCQDHIFTENEGSQVNQCCEPRMVPVFNNHVINQGTDDLVAELLSNKYIIPRGSCFYMSDLRDVQNLVPAESDSGFNLILIDPPWENSSAHQKSKYPTLPNRYFLSLSIKQLTHSLGSLVALWVTNREKLRRFVENDLFPSWGVKYAATFYWLKVKADGSLISELDLFHHRPYECLVLGYCPGKNGDSEGLLKQNPLPDNQVFISVPGDYSRKPPVGDFLLKYAPSVDHPRCIELFARELIGGWNSWGNEPLHFQDSKYFLNQTDR